jgi:membrane dipeptidase
VDREDGLARALGVSTEAVALTGSGELFDLHIDTLIPVRVYGYDLEKRHGLGIFRGRLFGHLDLPRIKDSGMAGAMWSITTNPARTAKGRWRVFEKNLGLLRSIVARSEGRLRIVRDHAELMEARRAGAHAVLPAIQGGNALEAAPEGPRSIPDRMITRVTLLHLTNSVYGATSSPLSRLRSDRGLSAKGREMVRALDEQRVFVDLAHIHPRGFWDAVEVHDKTLPLIATHTGVTGVKQSWRNLDDAQIKAIADSGGTIGVVFAEQHIKTSSTSPGPGMILDHLEHVIRVAGEDFASIGSDYDGFIIPPPELRNGVAYARLVQGMLDRRWSIDRIRKILGRNFLRAFRALRPGLVTAASA